MTRPHEARRAVPSGIRPTRAEIDLAAIVSNARAIKGVVGADVDVLAVVKADAYGHGAVPVAKALAGSDDVSALAVSLAEEAIELRRGQVPGQIIVMGGVFGGAHRDLVANDITPIVSDAFDVQAFSRAALQLGRRVGIHVKLDTGMSRLGVRPEGLSGFLDAVAEAPGVAITGFCTHLHSADGPDPAATTEQLRRFEEAIPLVRAAAAADGPILVHAANSAGTIRFAAARYDAVRPGLALYGGQSLRAVGDVDLLPAMRFTTAVAALRDVEAGDSVSYGAHWTATRRSRIATLPAGYADGYPRRLSGMADEGRPGADVLIRGRRCPVVGAVCMDMTLVDVSALGDEIAVGDEAVLLGEQGDERITAAELAEKAGLIEYEITCGISKRVPRVYLHA